VVWGDPCTEGSQTAKSGTDGQKQYMRLFNVDKQAHLCEVLRSPKALFSRYCRNRRKEKALTRGGLELYELLFEKSAEVIVATSNEPLPKKKQVESGSLTRERRTEH
jgi:hypothetical protein